MIEAQDADIDNLNQFEDQVVEGSSDADYVPPSDFSKPPTPGVYSFQRVDSETEPLKSGRSITKDGKLMAWWNFKVQILGGVFDGRTSYQGINTYVGSFRPSCSAADYVRATGSQLRPQTVLEYEAAIGRALVEKMTKKDKDGNRTEIPLNPPLTPLPAKIASPFLAKTTWEWTDSEGTVFLKGYANPTSPKRYTGAKINTRYVTTKDEKGNQKRVADHVQIGPDGAEYGARLVITDFVIPKTPNRVGPPRNENAG